MLALKLESRLTANTMVFFRYSYMIDNIILLITGTLHQRPITELVPKCHPLGSFEEMASINIASTPAELYNAVMIDTPLGETRQFRVRIIILKACHQAHVACENALMHPSVSKGKAVLYELKSKASWSK